MWVEVGMLDAVIRQVRARDPGIRVAVDSGGPGSRSFVDFVYGHGASEVTVSVEAPEGRGFGIYRPGESFGTNPDEIIAGEREAAARVLVLLGLGPPCLACGFCYMEPDADYPVCGHADTGNVFGVYIHRARAADGHCGPLGPKFVQHVSRSPEGWLPPREKGS